MSGWKEVEDAAASSLERLGKKISRKLNMSTEELLLLERRRKRRRFLNHRNAYLIVNVFLWILLAVIEKQVRPAMVISLSWGVGLAFHTLGIYRWLDDHDRDLKAAEDWVRMQGREDLLYLVESEDATLQLGVGTDPMVLRCEAAARQTREVLEKLQIGDVETLAVIDGGLERVRALISDRDDIERVLKEAAPESLDAERAKLSARLEAATDPDTRTLYQSQLELLAARGAKVQTLHGLLERIEAYAEGYLASLTNLRMDAAHLKVAELPPGAELAQLTRPLRNLEDQMEGMRRAAAEVAQAVRAGQPR